MTHNGFPRSEAIKLRYEVHHQRKFRSVRYRCTPGCVLQISKAVTSPAIIPETFAQLLFAITDDSIRPITEQRWNEYTHGSCKMFFIWKIFFASPIKTNSTTIRCDISLCSIHGSCFYSPFTRSPCHCVQQAGSQLKKRMQWPQVLGAARP